MTFSPRLSLPYLAPQQAQKHVTVNEAIRRLDALLQLVVKSRGVTSEPNAPAEGDAYILAATHQGAAWGAMSVNALAVFQDGQWIEIAPKTGWRAFIEDEAKLVIRSAAGSWTEMSGGAGETAAKFGVNTGADQTTRLQVKADASLFNHDDQTPGSGDHRMKINKSAVAKTASLVFQSGASGRAEFGLAGDDDFHVKISADGANWRESLIVDRESGEAAFPLSPALSGRNLLINGDFQINQRGFSGGALAAGSYGFDRWKASAAGVATQSLSGRTLTLTSGTLVQVIEAPNVAGLKLTISVGDLSGGALNVTIAAAGGGSGSASGSIAPGSGRRGVTLTVPASASAHLELQLTPAAGAVTFREVQVEIGKIATLFERRLPGLELLLCQRYFLKTFPMATAPTQNSGVFQGAITVGPTPAGGGAGTLCGTWNFPARMRAAPTITTFNPQGANANWRTGLGTDVAALQLFNSETNAILTNNATSAASIHYIHATATAEL